MLCGVALRFATYWTADPTKKLLQSTTLALLGILAGSAALFIHQPVNYGPFSLDALTACWFFLWIIGNATGNRSLSPLGEAFGSLGLLCHTTILTSVFLVLCLADHTMKRQSPSTSPAVSAWRLGILAPASCILAVTPLMPDLVFLAPAAGLAFLPAFAEMPVLAYSVLVPPLLDATSFFWPVSLIILGGVFSFVPRARLTRSFWPLFLLGMTLCARLGGLPDSALAGSEAFLLALALDNQRMKGWANLFCIPFPPLAGFLPFWLGLHVISGLSSLSPAWTAASVILSLLIGVLLVRTWLLTWSEFTKGGALIRVHSIPALTIGLCLSICPGLLLGLVHPALLKIAGSNPEIWRRWPLWSIAGGDGTFWYPALVFMIPALVAPAFMSGFLTTPFALPSWPPMPVAMRLSWPIKRRLIALRRFQRPILSRLYTTLIMHDRVRGPLLGNPITYLSGHSSLVFALALLGVALGWLGWSSR